MRKKQWFKAVRLSTSVLMPVTLALILCSCSQKPVKEFRLTIIVSDRLGEHETDELPQEIIELSLPIQDCVDFYLVPKPSLYRLGYDRSTMLKLVKTHKEKGFAKNPKNPRVLRRSIEKHLSSMQVGEVFAQPNNSSVNLEAELRSYLSSIGEGVTRLILNNTGEQGVSFDEIETFDTMDAVRSAISSAICQNGASSVVVFIDPPGTIVVVGGGGGEGDDDHQTPPRGDYWDTYERAQERIYGEEHHEAFALLEEAVEEAIDAGEAHFLLDRINGERNTRIWRLSHGHPERWDGIIEALEDSDKNKLYGHSSH